MTEKIEYRQKTFGFDLQQKQFEDAEAKDYYTFTGLASTFGNVDEQSEIVMAGAFKETIKDWKKRGRDVPMLWQHDRTNPIGVFKDLKETDLGLEVKGFFPTKRKDKFVEDKVIPQLEIGSVRSMSIGFSLEKWMRNERDETLELHKVNLREISLVTTPANVMAVITSLKADDISKYDVRVLEKILTKDGALFSQKLAKTVISSLKKYGYRDDVLNDERDAIKDFGKKELILQRLNNILDYKG